MDHAAPPPARLLPLDRRSLFRAGALGLAGGLAGGLAVPAAASASGFTHGVASGEPAADRVLLWTRFVGSGEARLGWEVAESQDFARVITSGEVLAAPGRDWCAKAVATGLQPGKWYYYRFIGPAGERSVIGRTRTLPVGKLRSFKLAVFSCSNFGFGWFNAYAHAAEAGEFDLALHLGDYLYEYQRGNYPSTKQALPERELWPATEVIALADYRLRHATYRSDPDLQRLHQLLPMVAMWDDHETANDTWKDGAENHQSASEGDWALRKAAAEQAWREWLPVSDDYWAKYEIGDLATIFRLETRHVARSEPFDLGQHSGAAALAAFRDGAWRDPARELLGAEQQAWLSAGLKQSARARKPWQVVAQQVIMGELALPASVAESLPDKAPAQVREAITAMAAASGVGLPLNMDAWDGYPAARERLLAGALNADANLLVLAGDSHNAWAFDLDHQRERAGVEMAVHSVTSSGAETELPWIKPADLASRLLQRNRQLKWTDTSQRGYLVVELTPQHAVGEWRFLAGVRQRGTALAGTHRMTVLAGQRRFTPG